jgi:hypothetical protein
MILAVDVPTLIAIMAGISGIVAGIGAVFIHHKEATTHADTSYVDNNLRAMQALVDNAVSTEVRVQTRCDAAEAEVAKLRVALIDCERRCAECLSRVSRLEKRLRN